MKVIRQSDDKRVVMIQRIGGIAVSVWEEAWNASARMMLSGWKLKATGLDESAADRLFNQLAG